LEAADSGQYGEPPPSELLSLALDCNKYNALPVAGQIGEQPAGLLEKLSKLSAVYKAFHGMIHTSLEMSEWTRTYPSMYELVTRVEIMRRDKVRGTGIWQT